MAVLGKTRRGHGTGCEPLRPVPISRRDGVTTWKTRPNPSHGKPNNEDISVKDIKRSTKVGTTIKLD